MVINLSFTDSNIKAIEQALETAQSLGIYGLKCLQTLLALHSSASDILDPEILLSAISFMSSRDRWTTVSSESTATSILSARYHQTQTPEFIITFILQSIIRPLFSKSKPAGITATGRKAMTSTVPPRNYNISDSFDPAQKPWKYTSPFSIPVFEWTVENSSVATLSISFQFCSKI
jgi:hypothetical protein